MTLNVTGN